jgi:hypothetical protein
MLNYQCPVCGQTSEFVLNEEQAFCTNDETYRGGLTCKVLMFNPSLPDGGLSQAHEIEFETDEA